MEQSYGRLRDYKKFVEEIGCNHLLSDSQRLFFTEKRSINGASVGITGLNSAWSCSHDEQKGKIWSGGLWQICKFVQLIKDCNVKIALIHHPTGWFVEQEDLITDKTKHKTPLFDENNNLANQIATAYKQNPKLKIILWPGAGTFGHLLAHKHGIRNGVTSSEGWNGFHETWYEATELNRIFIEALRKVPLPAITIEPLSSIITKNHDVVSWDIKPLKAVLTNDLLPVTYGNVIFDEEKSEELF